MPPSALTLVCFKVQEAKLGPAGHMMRHLHPSESHFSGCVFEFCMIVWLYDSANEREYATCAATALNLQVLVSVTRGPSLELSCHDYPEQQSIACL